MRYRATCLTPLLVGDGRRLSPIDYMVWRDQVNVLDQTRIFRLLAKGPRLEGYLAQLRKAEKLDFSAWGGFAQNFADRRIPFEHPSSSAHWNRERGEHLFIPTFAAGPAGPYLPGSALKGAIRTGIVAARLNPGALRDVAGRMQSDRPPRRPAEPVEEQVLGNPGQSRMKAVGISDSLPVSFDAMRVYLIRVAALVARGGRLELGWKQSPRGTADGRRPEESTPYFAEMAAPGTVFEGRWEEDPFFSQPDILRALNWREAPGAARMFEACNQHAAGLLAAHRSYAEQAGLEQLAAALGELESRLGAIGRNGQACLLQMGLGAGFLSKVASLDTGAESYRQILQRVPLYSRAASTGLPFPKTRKVVFLEGRPATLPGWVLLEAG